MNFDEERKLLNDRDNPKSLNKLVVGHQWLVHWCARRFSKSYASHRDDIVQEGNIGLFKAIRRFDLSRPYRLSTYAGSAIRQHISMFILQNMTNVRVPHTQEFRNLTYNFKKALRKFGDTTGPMTEVQIQGLMKTFNCPREQVLTAYAMYEGDLSLNAPMGEDGTFSDLFETGEASIETTMISSQDEQALRDRITPVLGRLSAPVREIIELRYLGEEMESRASVARQKSTTVDKVRRAEKRFTAAMRRAA